MYIKYNGRKELILGYLTWYLRKKLKYVVLTQASLSPTSMGCLLQFWRIWRISGENFCFKKTIFCWVTDSVIFEATLSVWVVFTRNALGRLSLGWDWMCVPYVRVRCSFWVCYKGRIACGYWWGQLDIYPTFRKGRLSTSALLAFSDGCRCPVVAFELNLMESSLGNEWSCLGQWCGWWPGRGCGHSWSGRWLGHGQIARHAWGQISWKNLRSSCLLVYELLHAQFGTVCVYVHRLCVNFIMLKL